MDRRPRLLLAIAAGTGEVLMSRLREGRANTARGGAHFLRETVGRGALRTQGTTHGAGRQGFYAHTVVAACREMESASLSPSERASLRDRDDTRGGLDGWTAPPDGRDDLHPVQAGRCAGAAEHPAGEAEARVPSSQFFARYSCLHHRPRWGATLELEADHRRHAEVENAIRDLKYGVGLNHMPVGAAANRLAW